jgi:hypothetical protein
MLYLKLLQFLNLHQFLNNQLLNQLNNLRKAKVDSSEDLKMHSAFERKMMLQHNLHNLHNQQLCNRQHQLFQVPLKKEETSFKN